MNQLDPSRSKEYIRGALDGMCTKTDGGTDNLSDGQHQLPTEISIFHSIPPLLKKLVAYLETAIPLISTGGISER
jgi:hypothetical protein